MTAPPAALTVFAAGSLRAPLTEIADAFGAVRLVFGASGLLKDRLLAGENAQVFASANMEHPQALAAAGRAEPVQAFAANALCVLAAPGFSLEGRTLVERLLDERVKVGTSTPKADPSGDYAFEMFDRVESTGAAPAGSAAKLKAKALQLTGGPNSPPVSRPERGTYAALVEDGHADVFVTYCTNAVAARKQVPSLQVLQVPDAVNVRAVYGLALLKPAGNDAVRFVEFLLGPEGRRRLAGHGFLAP